MKKLREKRYIMLIMITILFAFIVLINKIGREDITRENIYLNSAKIESVESLKANINDIQEENKIISKGYDEIKYEIKYKLSEGEEKRKINIKATLNDGEVKYAAFKDITKDNIVSKVSEDLKEIDIEISNVKPGVENKVDLLISISNAPNNFKVSPKIEIKEAKEKEYIKVNTKEVIVKTTSITGLVLDENKTGMENIELRIINEKNEEIKRTYSDKNGQYTFSDIENGKYKIEVVEDKYEIIENESVEVKESIENNIIVKNIKPYKIEVHKYINKVRLRINGKEEEYVYGNIEKVNQAVKNLKEIRGEIEYKVVIENTGKKAGIVTKAETTFEKGLTYNKNKNIGWKEKNNKLYNEEIEGIELKPGEIKELKLILDIEKTEEAKEYLSKVTVTGEVYEKVSYILNNEIYKEVEVLEGEKIEDIKVNKEEFSGWHTDKNYTNKYNFNNEVTKDIVLYGKTKIETKKYTVTFVDEGNIIGIKEYEEGSLIVKPEDPKKEGYTFEFWTLDNKTEYDLNTPVTENIILYSKYKRNKYEIKFVNNDGSELQKEKANYDELPVYKGETPKRVSTEEELKENTYEFIGWEPEIEKATKDMTYKAKYKEIKERYTVRFIDEEKEVLNRNDVLYGEVITVNEPKKEGYKFIGWYTENEEKIEIPLTTTKNVTAYSRYEEITHTVKFYDKDNEIEEFRKTVVHKESVKEPELAPAEEDLKFIGWVIRGTNTPYVFGTPVTEDIELECVFTEKETYTVTFNIEGDITILEPITVKEGNKGIERPEDVVKKGYIFDGWYIDNTYSEKYKFNEEIKNNIEIYGRYKEVSHKVEYYNDNNLYEEETVLDEYTANGPTKGNPVKDGYTFKYWTLEEETDFSENPLPYNFDAPVKNDIKLYAVYEINEYIITFVNDDGSILEIKEKMHYGEMPEYTKGTPIKENDREYNYTFNGWEPEIEEVTEDKTYKAVYTRELRKYTITFINDNGDELQKESLEFGSTPEYRGEIPTKENNSQYSYTFNGWEPEIEEVTEDKVYVATYKEETNAYTVTFIDHEEEDVVNVFYGDTVSEKEPKIEEHNIFLGWKLNGEIFDFDTKIEESIVLISDYELVEKPEINHTPIEWTKDNVIVTITNIEHPEYTYMYKLEGEEEYHNYTGEFIVSDNTVVIAKSIKENVESAVERHEINNIDKISPKIYVGEENTVEAESTSPTTIDVRYLTRDDESGISETKIYLKNVKPEEAESLEEEVEIYSEIFDSEINEEKEINYTINNLEENTLYKIKIISKDKVGNISEIIEKEVRTQERVIVAKIIGRNSELNKELIEREIEEARALLGEGETLSEEIIKEIKERHKDEEYENLDAAIKACLNNQCTIEMVRDTKESVEVLEEQNVTIDINGKEIISNSSQTILNNGKLTIIDTAENIGSIRNEDGVGIKNNNTLTLGEDDEERNVSITKPYIYGKTTGISTIKDSILNFYDGMVEGLVAIDGEVTKTPYLYNVRVEDPSNQIATLTILSEAEARINGSKYYTKVESAVEESKNGYYESKTTTGNITSFVQTNKDISYYFKYNSEDESLVSTNEGVLNSSSNSYIKLDLTNYRQDQQLVINAEINSELNGDFGYVMITNTDQTPEYAGNYIGKMLFISGLEEAKDYKVLLKSGQVYYIHMGYQKNNNRNMDTELDRFKINSISMIPVIKSEGIEFETPGSYGFIYNKEDETLINNNQNITNSVANSYFKIDTTGETEEQLLTVNAQVSSESGSDIGYVTITESETIPAFNNSTGRLMYISGEREAQNYTRKLSPNKIYYVHIGYRKDNRNNAGLDTFKINSIKLGEETLKFNTYLGEETNEYTNVVNIPKLNKEVDKIELLKTITLKNSLEIEDTRDVVLDLKGQTLTSESTDYVIKNKGSLKVIDSKYTDDIENAQKTYEEELAKNKLDYETKLEKYNKYKEEKQIEYNTTYISELELAKNTKYTIDDYVKEDLLLQVDSKENKDNNTMEDFSGNNKNGVMTNVELKDGAFIFNGIDSSVNFGIAKDLGLEDDHSVTIDVLVKYSDSQSQKIIVAAWDNSVGGIALGIDDNDIIKQSTNSYDYNTLKNTEKLNDGNLKHLVGVYDFDNNQMKLYIDGILVKSQDLNEGLTLGDNILTVGSWSGTSQFYKGNLYNVSIYNRALTDEEIEKNYQVNHARYQENKMKLTSNTSYGELSSNIDNSEEYKVFDGNKETTWSSLGEENYLLWELPEEKTITSFKIYGSNDTTKNPKTVELFGSKNGEEYITLSSTNIDTVSEDGLNIDIEKEKYDSYKYFKWNLKNENNNIEISEIELEIYNVERQLFKNGTKIETNIDNFVYNIPNPGTYNKMYNSGNDLQIIVSDGENSSVTYYKEKFIVEEERSLTIKGNLGLWNNYGGTLGEAYIGFSKTNERTVADFDSYIKRNINTTIEKSEDFEITIDEPGEYYFKMILYHNNLVNRYTVYANLRNLSFSTLPKEKETILRDSTQLGNITGTAGNVILNDENANLTIEQAIVNVNANGTNRMWIDGISNYGTLTLKEQSVINSDKSYVYIINNKRTGNILGSNGTINENNISNSCAIYNTSEEQIELSSLNINIKNNSNINGIYTEKDLNLKDINIIGSGYGITSSNGSVVNVNSGINISTTIGILSPENTISDIVVNEGAIIKGKDQGIYIHRNYSNNIYNGKTTSSLTINGGLIEGSQNGLYNYSTDSNNNIVNLNSGIIKSASVGIYSFYGKLNISGGHIESTNSGITGYSFSGNITGGEILHTSSYGINLNNYSNIDIGGNFTILNESSGNGISLNTGSNVTIQENVKILGNNTFGIENKENGTIVIKDNVIINSNNAAVYNQSKGTITIGEKDGNISKEYPKINSSKYAIHNSYGVVNYYDGVLIGEKENAILGSINDSEEEYDLFIKDENNLLENITLKIPTLNENGQVVKMNDTYYPSIASAIKEVKDGEQNKIEVLKDIRTIVSNNINNTKDIELDINGKSVKTYQALPLLVNEGVLKIKDNTGSENNYGTGIIISSSSIALENKGILDINNSVINGPKTAIKNIGELNILSSKMDSIENGSSYTVLNEESGNVLIEKSTLSGTNTVYNNSSGKITISDSTVTNRGNLGVVTNVLSGEIEIDNSIIQNLRDGYGIYGYGTGEITVKDGTIRGSNGAIKNMDKTSTINIENGTIVGSTENRGILNITGGNFKNYVYNNASDAVINMSGGNIESSDNYTLYNNNGSGSIINITGGTIKNTSGYNRYAVANRTDCIINIGIKGDTKEDGTLNVSKENPLIESNYIGVLNSSNGTLNFYDGIIKGATGAISGNVKEIEDGYEIITDTKKEPGKEVKYLDRLPVAVILDSEGRKTNLQCGTTEEVACYDLQTSINVAKEGETISIYRNIDILETQEAFTIPVDKNIIIDINGKTVSVGNPKMLINEGTLKIKDNTNSENDYGVGIITSSNNMVIENKGTLDINNLVIYAPVNAILNTGDLKIISSKVDSSERASDSRGISVLNEESGNVLIENSTLSGTSTVYNNGSGKVTINGSTITSRGNYRHAVSNSSESSGKIEINGGIIQNTYEGYAIGGYGTGEITVKDGTIRGSYGAIRNMDATSTINVENGSIVNETQNKGILNITGGNFKNRVYNYASDAVINMSGGSIESSDNYALYNDNGSGSIINITGGTIKNTSGYNRSSAVANRTDGIINIGIKGDTKEDGSLNVSKENPLIESTNNIGVSNSSNGTINFYDGIIKGATGAISGKINEVEDDYEIIKDTENNLEVKYLGKLPIAKILSTNEEYYTLQEAINEVTKKNETIEILRDSTTLSTSESVNISDDKDIIVDLNGHTITSNNGLFINNLGTLKLIDSRNDIDENGYIVSGTGKIMSDSGTIIENSGTLELAGATISTTPSSLANKTSLIRNINNGLFKFTSGKISYIATADGNGNAIENISTNKLEMFGGEIEISSVNSGGASAVNTSSGIVEIKGRVKINQIGSNSSYRGINATGGRVNIGGNSEINTSTPIVNDGGEIIIDGTNIVGTYIRSDSGTITINETTENSTTINISSGISNYRDSILNIAGGTLKSIGNSNNFIDNYNGTINVSGGNLIHELNSIYSSLFNIVSGMLNITNGNIVSFGKVVNNDAGTINITGGNLTSQNSMITNVSGTVNVSNITLENSNIGIEQTGKGTININENVVINSTNIAINNTGEGIINIGEKENVNFNNPIITGGNYGIYNARGNVYFYDGVITGALNQSIFGAITDTESGYKVRKDQSGNIESATLEVIGSEERIIVVNGLNFLKLQSAINASKYSEDASIETIATLYSNINLNENIIVPEGRNIKLYLNGNTISYNGYNFITTGNSKIEIIDGTASSSILGNIVESIKDVLNIDNKVKNVVVYEMLDGSKLLSNKTYKLYKDNKLLNMSKDEEVGRYSIGNKNEEMTTVRGRIYLNNLESGSYKLIDNDGKETTFTIMEDKVLGHAREIFDNTNNKVVASAVASLIITIQTGGFINNLLILLILISIIGILLFLIQRQKRFL